MDFEAYRRAYFVTPAPEPRFPLVGINGVSLYIDEYEQALAFYETVLGPPAYVEGARTHGWRIGDGWLTLFPAERGGPANMDVTILVENADAVASLFQAFVDAGAAGQPPSDQLMYEPVRYASVKDPFGTVIILVSRLSQG